MSDTTLSLIIAVESWALTMIKLITYTCQQHQTVYMMLKYIMISHALIVSGSNMHVMHVWKSILAKCEL